MAGPERVPLLHEELTGEIRQTAWEVHRYFGRGFLEKVYENALVHRLRKKGFAVEQQCSLAVYDEDGTCVGDYDADLFVDDLVTVEVKAAKKLIGRHEAQVLNYMKASRVRVGLLINFGASRLQCRRFIGGPFSGEPTPLAERRASPGDHPSVSRRLGDAR